MITDFCKLTFANSYAVLIKHFNMGYFRGYSKYDICLLEACFLKIRQVGGRRVSLVKQEVIRFRAECITLRVMGIKMLLV